MRSYRGPDGDERLWYEPDEIESIAEDELRKSGLTPTAMSPVVDIERLIEGHLHAGLDLAADLPPDVLGQTVFESDGRASVAINRALTAEIDELETTGSLGRWRATLAHEAGHILLHRHLFYLDSRQGHLFDPTAFDATPAAPTLMRCLKREVSFSARSYDWREVQANRAMAALLMPRHLFRQLARQHLDALGIDAQAPFLSDSPIVARLASSLASAFEVSRVAASIRLSTLGFMKPSEATPLRA